MFGIENYGIFLLSGILLNLTPGSDTIYILGRSMGQGKKAGIISALGISTGAIIHTLMVALGLSVILAKSAIAFNFIKYLGAGYLIYLGIKTLAYKKEIVVESGEDKKVGLKKVYFEGIITNLLNPKVALFFLAFLPQFINPYNDYGAIPFLLLGFTFITTGTIWCVLLAVFSSYMTNKIRQEKKISILLNKITGIIFVGLGLNLLRAKMSN